ncbi:MAG: nucleotidyltransferase family protein [Proteobacteria bacterium]|nr:nucleotidyltransferase family protein [Pseudomonadota bacterium]
MISTVYAVLLAAGASRRFGKDNKLLIEIEGKPLVRRVAQRLLASRAAGVIVVTGFEAKRIAEALSGLDVQFAANPDYTAGLSSSIRCGVAALPEGAGGAMIALADMPGLTTALVDRLLAAFAQAGARKIVYPAGARQAQGNPVIWPARFFAQLQTLTGDAGARKLIGGNGDETRALRVDDEAMLRDIDTPGDLEQVRRFLSCFFTMSIY